MPSAARACTPRPLPRAGWMAHAFADHPETAAAFANRALRLSPFDTSAFEAHMALGLVAVRAARYEEAISCFAKLSQINPRFSTGYFLEAIALALARRSEESKVWVKRRLELEPGFLVRFFSQLGMATPIADKLTKGAVLDMKPTCRDGSPRTLPESERTPIIVARLPSCQASPRTTPNLSR